MSRPRAIWAPTADPAEVPTTRSAADRSTPLRRRPAARPVCQAIPTGPPPLSTSALVISPPPSFRPRHHWKRRSGPYSARLAWFRATGLALPAFGGPARGRPADRLGLPGRLLVAAPPGPAGQRSVLGLLLRVAHLRRPGRGRLVAAHPRHRPPRPRRLPAPGTSRAPIPADAHLAPGGRERGAGRLQPLAGRTGRQRQGRPGLAALRMRGIAGALLRYRILAYVVGVGLAVLVFIGMPLQYLGHTKAVVAVVGPIHGFLYIVYLAAALDMARRC